MSDELYEGLRKMYESFFSKKNLLEERKEKYLNENEYQYYKKETEDLDKNSKRFIKLL